MNHKLFIKLTDRYRILRMKSRTETTPLRNPRTQDRLGPFIQGQNLEPQRGHEPEMLRILRLESGQGLGNSLFNSRLTDTYES